MQNALCEGLKRGQLQGSESAMRIKQWKEESNPLRKLVCVGTHLERKKWGLFSQAVGICGRGHSPEGQFEE